MTNDLAHFLLVTLCLFGGIATMLYLLAAVDCQTDRTALSYPKARQAVRRPTGWGMSDNDPDTNEFFTMAVSSRGPYCVVRLAGELDVSTVSRLRNVLTERLVDGGDVHVVVDLTDLTFMDSSGLHFLARAKKTTRALRGSLAVVCPEGPVLRVIAISGLLHVLRVHESLEAATAEPPEPDKLGPVPE